MSETKTKSPSIRKRDTIRMFKFNMKKKENAIARLQQELMNKSKVVLKLETEVSCLKFNHCMRKPELSVVHRVSVQDIPPKPSLDHPHNPYPHASHPGKYLECCQHRCNTGRRRTDSGDALPETLCCNHKCKPGPLR